MTKTTETPAAVAADTAAAAVDPAAAPAHVESGAAELADEDDPERPTHADMERTIAALTKLDTRLHAEGHTLADVLATAAKNAYGVDVR